VQQHYRKYYRILRYNVFSSSKVNRRFRGIHHLYLQSRRINRARNQRENSAWLCLSPAFKLVSCSVYSSTMKMEAIRSSETLVDFQRTTQRYIPGDSNFHNYRCENLKSYNIILDEMGIWWILKRGLQFDNCDYRWWFRVSETWLSKGESNSP
jgi:hypothetical protein